MRKKPLGQDPKAVPAQTASQDENNQATERRRFEDRLEDDEVYEALKLYHTPERD